MTKAIIVYPTDPLGIVPGGTDTCIRDILRCAPADIEMCLVGVTTDAIARPAGQWNDCELSGRSFKFYPLMVVSDLGRQMRIPLSVKFTARLFGKSHVLKDADVIQFNRIEPMIATLGLDTPKLLIIHQNMNVLKNKKSDIRWRYLPSMYFTVEDFLVRRLKEVFIVREDAVAQYRNRFPERAKSIHFLPTWMNQNLFYSIDVITKRTERKTQFVEFGLQGDELLLIFVGRFDQQKDPLYLIDSLIELSKRRTDWRMLMIGDGVLHSEVKKRIAENRLGEQIHLLGSKSQDEVARYLRLSDLLLLSSAYEGMPRCVVEALGSGVPVVTSKAGEVELLINQGKNGYIVDEKNALLFAEYIAKALDELDQLSGAPCLKAVEQYTADIVLARLYNSYRVHARQTR